MEHAGSRKMIFICLSLAVIGIGYLVTISSVHEQTVALNTLRLGLGAACISLPLGIGMAWACQANHWISRLLLLASFIFILIPVFIHVSAWDAAFGKLGWLSVSQGQTLVPLVTGWKAAIWIHGTAAAPWVGILLTIGLRTAQSVSLDQARLEMSETAIFWRLTLPRLLPLLCLGMMWTVLSCAREIAVTDLYQIGTLAEQIYLGYSLGWGAPTAGAWTPEQVRLASNLSPYLTLWVTGIFSLIGWVVFERLIHVPLRSDLWRPFQKQHRRSSPLQHLLGILLVIFLMGVPLYNTIARASFFARPHEGNILTGYSVSQCFSAISKSCQDYQAEFVWSGLIALSSSLLIIGFALVVTGLGKRHRFARWIMAALIAVCLALPGPYVGSMVARLFVVVDNEFFEWLSHYTIAAPVLANAIFCWPLGALLVWFLVRQTPQDVIESASLDGVSPVQQWLHFSVWGNIRLLIGIFLVMFALCFGELSASQMVRPAGMDTVPRKMLGDLHAGVNELTAGVTLCAGCAIAGATMLGWALIFLGRKP